MSGIINLQSFCKLTEALETEQDVLHSSPETDTRHDVSNGSFPKKAYLQPKCVLIMPKKCE